MRILILVFALIVSFFLELRAQDLTTIRLIDDLTKKPVNEVNVKVGDSLRTKSNVLGLFQIDANEGDTIKFSHPNYIDKIVIRPSVNKFTVPLDKQVTLLDFTDGIKTFYEHFGSKIQYPSNARSARLQKTVYILFKVDSLGGMTDVQFHNDAKNIFTKQLKEVIKSIKGKWSIEYAGRTFLLPIVYRLETGGKIDNEFNDDFLVDRRLSEIVVMGYSR